MAKKAVINLAEKFAVECRGQPRINSIEPSGLSSPMRARAYPGEDIKQHAAIETAMPKYIQLMDKTCELNGTQL